MLQNEAQNARKPCLRCVAQSLMLAFLLFFQFVINFFCFFRFLDMHMYITSALQRTDMKAVGLQLALDLLHEKVG